MDLISPIFEKVIETSVVGAFLLASLVLVTRYFLKQLDKRDEVMKIKDLEIQQLYEKNSKMLAEQVEILTKVNVYLETYLKNSESSSDKVIQSLQNEIQLLKSHIDKRLEEKLK